MTGNKTRAVSVRCPALVAGMLVLAGLAGCGGDSSAESQAPPSPATPAAEPLTMPTGNEAVDQAIAPGSYRVPSSEWSAVPFTVTFPAGWTVQYGHVYHRVGDRGESSEFYAIDLDEIYTDACHGPGVPRAVGPDVDDLVTALLDQEGPVADEPVETTLGGHPATLVHLSVPRRLDLDDCRLADDGVLGLQLWYSVPADKYLVLQRGDGVDVYILDVDGERQVFLTQQFSPTRQDRAELQAVLDSVRVG